MCRFLLALCLSLLALAPLSAEDHHAVRTDALGDPLPAGAIARLGTTRLWHGASIGAVTLSPDGKIVATAGHRGRGAFDGPFWINLPDRTLRLWDAGTGKELRQFQTTPELGSLAFSPDGKALAGSCAGLVWVIDVASGRELHRFELRQEHQARVEFVGDGSRLKTTERNGGRIDVWDLTGGAKHVHWEPPWTKAKGETRQKSALSPDGKLLAWVHKREVRPESSYFVTAYAAATFKKLYSVRLPKSENFYDEVTDFAFSPDGKVLAISEDWSLLFLDAATGQRAFPNIECRRDEGPASFIFTPDSKELAAISFNGDIRVWDIASGKQQRVLTSNHAPIDTLYGSVHIGISSFDSCDSLSFSADGRTLARAGATKAMLWDVRTGRLQPVWPGHLDVVECLTFSHDGRKLFSASEALCTWQADDWRPLSRMPLPASQIPFQEKRPLSADGRLYARRMKMGTINLYNALTGKEQHELRPCEVEPMPDRIDPNFFDCEVPAVFSADGSKVVSLWRRDGRWLSEVFDTANGRSLRRLKLKDEPTVTAKVEDGAVPSWRMACSADAKWLAWHDLEGQILLGDLERGAPVRRLAPPAGAAKGTPMLTLAFAPDSRYLAAVYSNIGDDTSICAYEVATGREVLRLDVRQEDGQPARGASVVFSPDGRTLAVGRNDRDEVTVWEMASGRERHIFAGHRSAVRCLAFSPDGRTLASGSHDTTILVWDLAGILAPKRQGPPDARELEALWADLAGEDAVRAGEAVRVLKRYSEQSVPLLAARLRPTAAPDPERLKRLIADLSDTRYGVRARASQALEELNVLAEPALRGALAKSDLETRQRLEKLLAKTQGPVVTPSLLRALRGVEVLESAAMPEARRVLQALAEGAPGARLTVEARAALRRLDR